jgi:hypothetical protein
VTQVRSSPETNTANAELRRKMMGFIVAQAIHAVTEAGVVDHLAVGPATVAELAAATGTNHDALHRFLRALAGEGLFVESPQGTFALTETGALLRSDEPGSLRHFSTMMVGEAYQVWELAAHSLRTGEPAWELMFGQPMYSWFGANPDKAAVFYAAHAKLVERYMEPIVERDWTGVATVVDVGGGNGALLAKLLGGNPHLRGVLLELPGTVERARERLDAAGVLDRCRCVAGDFFVEVPGGGDVYILSQVLHSFTDDRAIELLDRCRAAMPSTGTLLVLDLAIRSDNEPDPAKLLDLHMLVLQAGRERTETDWRALLDKGGFDTVAITQHARTAVIEARPSSR